MTRFGKAILGLCIFGSAFLALVNASADTHKECQSSACVDVQGAGINQCSTNAHCDTECSVNGVGTGGLGSGSKCGECTGGACAGEDVGADCELNPASFGGSFSGGIKGKCEAQDFCSNADPGGKNYEGACGMQCLCKVKSKKAAEVEQAVWCENCGS